jgi:hypothetical protein
VDRTDDVLIVSMDRDLRNVKNKDDMVVMISRPSKNGDLKILEVFKNEEALKIYKLLTK